MLGFDSDNNLILGIFDKSQGNMRLFRQNGNPIMDHNRKMFFNSFNKRVMAADLVHGNKVTVVDDWTLGNIITGCDALVTASPDLILSITVADCLPVYFSDRIKKVVGLAHAGWRGVENKISQAVVKALVQNYNSNQSDIEVLIGPHIGVCHFEVQKDVLGKFSLWPDFAVKRAGKTFIDLAGIVKRQLLDVGIVNIDISSECAYCLKDKYFSFRRDNPGEDNLEVMAAYIGLK